MKRRCPEGDDKEEGDEDTEEGGSREAKRPAQCNPKRGCWCPECAETMTLARDTHELPNQTVCRLLTGGSDACPNRLTAYITALQLPLRPRQAANRPSLLSFLDLKEFPVDEAPPPPSLAPPPLSNATTTMAAAPMTPPLLDSVPVAPALAASTEETIEERNAYEDAFDIQYAHLIATSRATKRYFRDTLLWANRGFQERDVRPWEPRLRFQDEGHRYFIDNSSEDIMSASTYLHHFFTPFESKKHETATFCIGTRRYRETKSVADVLHIWDVNRDTGTSRHASIEDLLHCTRDRLHQYGKSLPTVEPPPSFFKLLHKHPYLRPVRCEMNLCDPAARICGQADCLMEDTRDGSYWLLDWKNTNEIRQTAFIDRKTKQKEMGTHPLTAHMEDCNYNHYLLQLNFYRHMLETYFNFPIKKMLLVNFPPAALPTDEPQEFEMPRQDVSAFFSLRTEELATKHGIRPEDVVTFYEQRAAAAVA